MNSGPVLESATFLEPFVKQRRLCRNVSKLCVRHGCFNAASGHSYYFSETRCLSKESKGVQSTDASILGFAVFGHLNMTNNTNSRNKSRLMFGKRQKFDGQQPQDYIQALERARPLPFQRMVSWLYSSVPGLGKAQKNIVFA